MRKTVLAAALSAAFITNTVIAEEATMSPDIITQSAAASSAPANGLVFGILLVGLLAVLAAGGGGGMHPYPYPS
jgi:hypothetical protein